MYQIDNATAVSSRPAASSAGTAGWFTDGNPGSGIPATILPAEFMNMIMAEHLGVLSAGGVTPDKTVSNQVALAIAAMISGAVIGVPTGCVIHVPKSTAPTGYLKLNGALLSRTTYAALYAFALASGNMAASDGAWVEGQFSPGDGSTTFRIPDMRGNFIRGFDDARGIDSGRTIGSLQTDAMQGHQHTYSYAAHSPARAGSTGDVPLTDTPTNTTAIVSDGTNGTPRTAAETRPRNIALLACIKY